MTRIKKIVVPVMIVALVIALTPLAGFGTGNVYGAAKLAAPAKVTATSSNKAKIKISWSKVAGAKGYTVYQKKGSKFKAVKTTKGKSATIKKLKKNKTYTFYVKAYKGKKKYGAASIKVTAQTKGSKKQNVKKIALDQQALTLYKGESQTLAATLTPAKKTVSSKITWTSSDKSVAAVDAKGVVTQVGSGTTTITATAHSGVQASCEVTAKAGSRDAADLLKDNVSKLEAAADESFAQMMTYTLAYNKRLNDVDTMFRGGGSAAEHATAEYIAQTYEDIGLEDVQKVPVTVDGWETGESYMNVGELKISDLVPYQATGTHNPDGSANPVSVRDSAQGETGMAEKTLADASWDNMSIVNVGKGDAEGYLDEDGNPIDVEGKVVLAEVNQYTENWIDQPYTEAFYHGAAAIITYQYDEFDMGYGMYDLLQHNETCDTINVQDICAPDLIPCGSISPRDGLAIAALMEQKGVRELDDVDLKLTCKVTPDTTAYVVTGKIPGKNHGQRILIGGHYDKYHGGVNDDCTAVALSTAIGKAMVDAKYQPENDIYIVAHCAEEWGLSGAADDWAMGSWQNITQAHEDWQKGTLAFINFEMPAIKSDQQQGQIQTSFEYNTQIQEFLDADIIEKSYYKDGVEVVNDHNMGMSDCISYQEKGVPCIINKPDFDCTSVPKGKTTSESWFMDRYHTKYDDMSTYSSDLMDYDISLYGGIAQCIDTNPALELDFTARCDEFEAEAEDLEAFLPTDKQDLVTQYNEKLAAFRAAGEEQLAKAQEINTAYAKAVLAGEDTAQLRAQGAELNKTTLQAFRTLEDKLMGIIGSDTYMTLHTTAVASMGAIQTAVADMQAGKVTDDGDECTLATIASINGMSEFVAFGYSKFSYDELQASINCTNEHIQDTWGYNKAVPVVDLCDATQNVLYQLYEAETPNYDESITAYNNAYNTLQEGLVTVLTQEVQGLDDAAKLLK